jgi:hypothetical protein
MVLNYNHIWILEELRHRGFIALAALAETRWLNEEALEPERVPQDMRSYLDVANQDATKYIIEREADFISVITLIARCLPDATNLQREATTGAAVRYTWNNHNWRITIRL